LHRTLAAIVASLLVGTLAVDGVVIAHKRSENSRRAARDRLVAVEHAYLDRVRQVARRLPTELRPVQFVLRAIERPHAGDIYAARDALSRLDAVEALSADVTFLQQSHVPAPLQHVGHEVVGALQEMRQALIAMRAQRGVVDPDSLSLNLQSAAASDLSRGIGDWRTGLQELFVRFREKAPQRPDNVVVGDPPPSGISWTFAADRACLRAHLHAATLLPGLRRRPVDFAAARRLGNLTESLSRQLHKIPLPAKAAQLRERVTSRLVTMRAWGRALVDESVAAIRGDLAGVRRAYDRFRTASGALPVLERGFRTVRAIACATFVSTGPGTGHRGGITA
jgi:hypothetical protein